MLIKLKVIKLIIFILMCYSLFVIANAETCGCGSDTTVSVKPASAPAASSCCSATIDTTAKQVSGCQTSGCGAPNASVKQMSQAKGTSNPDMDCGVWSLAYVAESLGIKKDEQAIKQLIQYDPAKGPTMQELAQGAQKLGLEAKGYRMSYAELSKRQKPVIVYLPNHFMVLTAIDTTTHILQFTDSSNKTMQISEMKFRDSWEGYVLEIKKK